MLVLYIYGPHLESSQRLPYNRFLNFSNLSANKSNDKLFCDIVMSLELWGPRSAVLLQEHSKKLQQIYVFLHLLFLTILSYSFFCIFIYNLGTVFFLLLFFVCFVLCFFLFLDYYPITFLNSVKRVYNDNR